MNQEKGHLMFDQATDSAGQAREPQAVLGSDRAPSVATENLDDIAPRASRKHILAAFLRHRGAVAAAVVLLLMGFGALFAPILLPTDPTAMNLTDASQSPNLHHLMGTDQFGRDIFTRVLYGGRITLTMGLLAVVVAAVVGIPLGLVAGYREGWTDMTVMRVMDIMLALPGLLLALAVIAVLGQGSTNVMIAVGVSLIPSYVRLVRGTVLSAKQNLYIEAGRAIGVSDWRILAYHILPNVLAPVVVLATVSIGWAIVIGTALNFLGMGVQYPTPEWGSDLNSGRDYLNVAWWLSTFPGLAIMVAILSFNLLGDGLREVLDPRLRLER
jgi:peptide/nickel transport system permease protein